MKGEIKPLLAIIFFAIIFFAILLMFILYKFVEKPKMHQPTLLEKEYEAYILNDSLMQLNENRAAMPLP